MDGANEDGIEAVLTNLVLQRRWLHASFVVSFLLVATAEALGSNLQPPKVGAVNKSVPLDFAEKEDAAKVETWGDGEQGHGGSSSHLLIQGFKLFGLPDTTRFGGAVEIAKFVTQVRHSAGPGVQE
jgi:hypothetical protein